MRLTAPGWCRLVRGKLTQERAPTRADQHIVRGAPSFCVSGARRCTRASPITLLVLGSHSSAGIVRVCLQMVRDGAPARYACMRVWAPEPISTPSPPLLRLHQRSGIVSPSAGDDHEGPQRNRCRLTIADVTAIALGLTGSGSLVGGGLDTPALIVGAARQRQTAAKAPGCGVIARGCRGRWVRRGSGWCHLLGTGRRSSCPQNADRGRSWRRRALGATGAG